MTWPAGTLVVCRSGTSKDSPRSGGLQYSPLVPLGMSTGVTIESGIVTIRTERIPSLVSADIITSLYILNLYLHVFASSDSICFCLCKDATSKHHQSRMQQKYSGVKMQMRRSVVESKWRLYYVSTEFIWLETTIGISRQLFFPSHSSSPHLAIKKKTPNRCVQR